MILLSLNNRQIIISKLIKSTETRKISVFFCDLIILKKIARGQIGLKKFSGFERKLPVH